MSAGEAAQYGSPCLGVRGCGDYEFFTGLIRLFYLVADVLRMLGSGV